MSKINLIFGISGQTGCYLAHYCKARGENVVGASRNASIIRSKPNISRLNLSDIHILSYNAQSYQSIAALIDAVMPTHIYYLSGQSSVSRSFDLCLETMHSVYSVALYILEYIRLRQPSIRFFNSGSSEIFGNTTYDLPACETTLHSPISPYAIAKSNSIQITNLYRNVYGLFSINGILSNHESILRPAHFVLSKTIKAIHDIKNNKASCLELGNIDIVRDWGWAAEYAEAIYPPPLFTATIEPELIRVCTTFVDLQSLRHSADYNTAISFKRAEVVAAISRAQAAHQDWALLRTSDNATVFLLHSAKLLPAR